MVERKPFGKDENPLIDPKIVRERLLGRLTSLFTFVESQGGWGGGVEPLLVEVETGPGVKEELLVVGGLVRFSVQARHVRRVGIINRMGEQGSYFVACEWPDTFDIDEWSQLSKEDRAGADFPLRFTHVLPDLPSPSSPDPNALSRDKAALDLYVFSMLSMTEFGNNPTAELQKILVG